MKKIAILFAIVLASLTCFACTKTPTPSIGAAGALMSGSGPTVFGIFKEEEKAKQAYEVLKKAEGGRLARQVYLSRFFNPKKADTRRGEK